LVSVANQNAAIDENSVCVHGGHCVHRVMLPIVSWTSRLVQNVDLYGFGRGTRLAQSVGFNFSGSLRFLATSTLRRSLKLTIAGALYPS